MPALYDSALDCSGEDSGKDDCWPTAVNIAVPVIACVGFVGVLIVQFIIWPWTKKWILCFFGEVSRPIEGEYISAEDATSADDLKATELSKVATLSHNDDLTDFDGAKNLAYSANSGADDSCIIVTSAGPAATKTSELVTGGSTIDNDTAF